MENEKSSISAFVIFEIIILILGIGMSIASTLKPLKYTMKYAWCFAFPVLGAFFVIALILMIRKKRAALIGVILAFVYLCTAGFGAIVCEVNTTRLRLLTHFEGKSVTVSFDDSVYEWDGKSVTYDPSKLEVDSKASGREDFACMVGGEKKDYLLYTDKGDRDVYYLEVSSAGTGIFLILSPKQ